MNYMVWKHNVSGDLSLKEAYCFKYGTLTEPPWANLI